MQRRRHDNRDRGRAFLKEHKLLRAKDTLREIYDRVEKTDEIRRYEAAPRPERRLFYR